MRGEDKQTWLVLLCAGSMHSGSAKAATDKADKVLAAAETQAKRDG